jgi:hypothetical protein
MFFTAAAWRAASRRSASLIAISVVVFVLKGFLEIAPYLA